MMKGETAGPGHEGETLEDVLAGAEEAGYSVSERQLKRWRDEGLVPSPRKVGLGREKGTTALYPAGTTKLVSAIARERENHRNLTAIGLKLWFQGAPLTEFARDFFLSLLQSHERTTQALFRAYESGRTDEPIQSWIDRDRLPSYGWLRKAVGRERFDVPVYLALCAMAGELDEKNLRTQMALFDEVHDSIDATLDASAKRFDMSDGAELGEDEITEFFRALSDQVSFGAIRERAKALSLKDWNQLRDRALDVVNRWQPNADEPEAHALAFLANLLSFPPAEPPLEDRIDMYVESDDPQVRSAGQKMRETLLTLEL